MTRADALSSADLSSLAFEGPEAPMHVMALLWLEPMPLLDPDGRIALHDIRRRVSARLDRAPRLRQVVVGRGRFRGAEWTDAASIDISHHVGAATLEPPGREGQLLDLAARVFMERLDRDRPLWRLLLVSGLADGRVVVMAKLHHAIADGPAAVRLLSALFDVPSAPVPVATPPGPSAANARPRSLLATVAGIRSGLAALAPAPRTSLNRRLGLGRRLALVQLELDEVKRVAHAHGGKVNDVLLTLASSGARAILDRRGESVAGGQLKASVFVGLRQDRAELGNATGVMLVGLPVLEGDPVRALDLVAKRTAVAKRQQPAAGMAAIMFLITRAGLGRALYRRQRQVNVFATNVVGPAVPVHLLGARVEDAAVVTPLSGNVALTFAALSFAGRLNVTVIGDAAACPEVEIAATAMREAWTALRAASEVDVVSNVGPSARPSLQ